MQGFANYLRLLNFNPESFEQNAVNFFTLNPIVPRGLRRIRIDRRNYLNKPGQKIYEEYVVATKDSYDELARWFAHRALKTAA